MFSNGKTNEIEKLTSTSKLSKSILDYEANEFLFFFGFFSNVFFVTRKSSKNTILLKNRRTKRKYQLFIKNIAHENAFLN